MMQNKHFQNSNIQFDNVHVFIGFMLKGKKLLDHGNLFSPTK